MNASIKTALVTGAARRIGCAIATALHQHNYNVMIHHHQSTQQALALAALFNSQRPGSAHTVCKNLLDADASEYILQAVVRQFGTLHLLVNNASLFIADPEASQVPQTFEQLMHCNVLAPYQLSLGARHLLQASSGSIINISDIHAAKPLKGYSLYCQSKAALNLQTQAMARELAPTIRVNAIAPGAIDWPEAGNTLNETQKQAIIAKTPLKCHGHPDYIAQAVLGLTQNPYISGQILAVDGGRSIA